jgi:hypothetical protein
MWNQPLGIDTMQQTLHTRQPRHASENPARDLLSASLIFAGLLTLIFVPTLLLGAVGGVAGFELLTRLRERASPSTGTGHTTETASGSRPTA